MCFQVRGVGTKRRGIRARGREREREKCRQDRSKQINQAARKEKKKEDTVSRLRKEGREEEKKLNKKYILSLVTMYSRFRLLGTVYLGNLAMYVYLSMTFFSFFLTRRFLTFLPLPLPLSSLPSTHLYLYRTIHRTAPHRTALPDPPIFPLSPRLVVQSGQGNQGPAGSMYK